MNTIREDQQGSISPHRDYMNVESQGLLHIQQNLSSNVYFEIQERQVQSIFQKYLSIQLGQIIEKRLSFRNEDVSKLQRPPMGESKFSNIRPFFIRLRKIMLKAYSREELKLSQFQEFEYFFKLGKNSIKFMNCNDPTVLQTLRFAIYNRQQIPASLVKVIVQMAKTNMVKEREFQFYIIYKIYMTNISPQDFQPPLDLYLEFIDTGLIEQNWEELNEVYIRNQFLFKSISNNNEFYPTLSQKKRLILNQFPYMIDIYDRISTHNHLGCNLGGFKLYLSSILNILQFPSEENLLDRYLPEVRCRYLKIKSNLSPSDIQYLFLSLKSITNFSTEDFHYLYQTKPNKVSQKQHQTTSWTKFGQVQQLCTNILTKKDFHLTKKQFEQLIQIINYEQCLSDDLIKINLILVMFRQQAYNNLQFPKYVLMNLSWFFKSIPDIKKKKQCCYILLHQYFTLINQNIQKRAEIVKGYAFLQNQIDVILDEGRQIALDILMEEKDVQLITNSKKSQEYEKILKKIMKESKNKIIRTKASQLSKRFKNDCKIKSSGLKSWQQCIMKDNELIEYLEAQAKNGKQISVQCINDIFKIMSENNKPSIKRSCLTTLRYLIKNHKEGQPLPEKFESNLIQLVSNTYFYGYLTQECKIEVILLTIECSNLSETYQFTQQLIKFLLQVYLKSPANGPLNINASFGIYSIALNFKQNSKNYYTPARNFLDIFANKMLKNYKNDFDPTSRGSINILCAIAALSKNMILLSNELLNYLTTIVLKNRNFTQIVLLTIYFRIKNPQSKTLSVDIILNVCQILKEHKNNQIIAVYILENYFENQKNLVPSVKAKIMELIKMKKCSNQSCERLCTFFKNRFLKN